MTEAEINMLNKVKEVYYWRKQVADLDYAMNELKKIWEEQNKEVIIGLRASKNRLEEVEAQLRAWAIQLFKETGNKTPGPGVEIKNYTTLEYDPKLALDWAMQKKMALKLDVKLFEQLAETVEDIPFVKITKEPRATIAQNLEKVLGEKK